MSIPHDTLYVEDKTVHTVASILHGETVETMCGKECAYDREQLSSTPINIITREEICVECERKHSYYRDKRFNFDETDGKYLYFIRFCTPSGRLQQTSVHATQVSDAKEKVIEEYGNVYKFYYIARTTDNQDWITVKQYRFTAY